MSRVRRRRHRQHKPDPAAEAARAAREQENRLLAAVTEVVVGHARLYSNLRRPVRCTPSWAELSGDATYRTPPGNSGKVIYDSREVANAAAAGIIAVGGLPQRPFPCGRHRPGHDGHWHLTTEGAAARSAKRQMLERRTTLHDMQEAS